MYNASYVLDDDNSLQSGSDPSSGRKSVDYLVDHIDDFEQAELSDTELAAMHDNTTLKTPLLRKSEKQGVNFKTIQHNKRPYGSGAANDEAGTAKKQRVAQQIAAQAAAGGSSNNNKNGGGPQKSLLKGTKVKQERETNDAVPDIIGFNNTSSPVSSTGSGKSFYSKDDLFVEDVPTELFDEKTCVSPSFFF